MTHTKEHGFLGFASSFAADKWLDANAVGPVTYRLNGHPGTYVFQPHCSCDPYAWNPLLSRDMCAVHGK